MTVGGKIFDLVWDMLWDADITSAAGPDVTNKVKSLEPDPGLVKAIDDAIENMPSKPKGKNQDAHIKEFEAYLKKKGKGGVSIYDPGEGAWEKGLNNALGGSGKGAKAISFLTNPVSSMMNFLKGPIGGPLMVATLSVSIVLMLTKELVRKGSVFDRTFKNVVDNRYEVLRTRELQQRIRVGFGEGSQLITTTNAGTTSPRYAFNSYELHNRGNTVKEDLFAIRNNSGYE